MKIFAPLFLGIVICAFTGLTGAAPLQWAGNGHYYEAVTNGSKITWEDAKTNAEKVGGYLATTTSTEENNFVFSLIDRPEFWYSKVNSAGPFLGGFQDSNGHWKWITGEVWSYINWSPGQPDNPYREPYLALFAWGENNRAASWNDISNYDTTIAYVIEYDSFPVPEPTTMLLFGTGLVGLGGFRRKFKG